MKIVVTGSLGHISKPLATELIQKGHDVVIVSSNPERKKEIEALGGNAAIGTMQDANFLTQTFKEADAVYVMETLGHNAFFDHSVNIVDAIMEIGNAYKVAIELSGVKRVVHLSSIGAHMSEGNGILKFHHEVERILNTVPDSVSMTALRPVGFYYNMLAFIPTIKTKGSIIANYGGDDKEPWVSPKDIAAVAVEELLKFTEGRNIRYIASDEVSPNEVAQILGEAIGKSDLTWEVITDDQLLSGLLAAGMNPDTAKGYVAMNASRRGGVLYEDYYRHYPTLGHVKLTDYAKEFAAAFNQN